MPRAASVTAVPAAPRGGPAQLSLSLQVGPPILPASLPEAVVSLAAAPGRSDGRLLGRPWLWARTPGAYSWRRLVQLGLPWTMAAAQEPTQGTRPPCQRTSGRRDAGGETPGHGRRGSGGTSRALFTLKRLHVTSRHGHRLYRNVRPWLRAVPAQALVLALLTSASGSWDQRAPPASGSPPDPPLTSGRSQCVNLVIHLPGASTRDPRAPSPLLCLLPPSTALTALHSSILETVALAFSLQDPRLLGMRIDCPQVGTIPSLEDAAAEMGAPCPPLHQSPHRPSSGTANGRRARRRVRRSGDSRPRHYTRAGLILY